MSEAVLPPRRQFKKDKLRPVYFRRLIPIDLRFELVAKSPKFIPPHSGPLHYLPRFPVQTVARNDCKRAMLVA